jgi:hypothetical protein
MIYDSSNRRRPNRVEHNSNGTTVIILERRSGFTMRCIIDTIDYPLVKDRRWYADKGAYTFYAKSTHPTTVKMHQLILPEIALVDHVDEDGLNNRRKNLRPGDRSLNALNTSRKRISGKTSKFPGVYRHHNRYQTAITVNGKKIFLGSFTRQKDAAEAYKRAKERLI